MREGVGYKKEATGQVGGCVCEMRPALCGRKDLPSGNCHVLKEVFLTPTRENSSPTLPRMLSGGIALELARAQLMKRPVRVHGSDEEGPLTLGTSRPLDSSHSTGAPPFQ